MGIESLLPYIRIDKNYKGRLMPKKTTYSSSRVSTFASCKLKYKLQYKDYLYADEKFKAIETRKGSAFHEFAEHYPKNIEGRKLEDVIKEYEVQFDIGDKYPLTKPVAKFIEMYEKFILALKGKHHVEYTFKFDVLGHLFTGRLDDYFELEPGKSTVVPPETEYIVFDYKTGKNIKVSTYKDQMLLYVHAIGQDKGLTDQELVKKVKVFLFYPFAAGSWDKVLQEVSFNEIDLEDVRERKAGLIEEIESNEWKPDPTMSFLCNFCPFKGFQEHCELTWKNRLYPTRGIKIKKRDWSKPRRY